MQRKAINDRLSATSFDSSSTKFIYGSDDEDDEMEEEQIVSQVLDEIGVELNGDMMSAPSGAIPVAQKAAPAKQAEAAAANGQEEDLQSRLDALRR